MSKIISVLNKKGMSISSVKDPDYRDALIDAVVAMLGDILSDSNLHGVTESAIERKMYVSKEIREWMRLADTIKAREDKLFGRYHENVINIER